MAGNFNISYIFKVIDKFSPAVKKINSNMNKFQGTVQKTQGKFSNLENRFKSFRSSSESLTRSVISLAGAYFSLRGAINFGRALINTQIQLQNINASLKAITGSQEKATAEFNFAKQIADELGVSFESIIKPYTKYIAASKDTTEVNREVFRSFLQTGRVLGLTDAKFKSVFIALEQIQSKGKLAAQELRVQLGDAIPGAFDLFARAAIRGSNGMIKNTAEFTKFLEQGRIGSGIIKEVAKLLQEEFGDASVEASKTLGAELARLQNRFFNLRQELSEGLFGNMVLSGVKFLTKNMDKVAKIALILGAIFAGYIALQIPFMFFSLAASINAALIPLMTFALFNPFGLIITGLTVLLSLFPKLRKDFITVITFIGNGIKNFIISALDWFKPFIDAFKSTIELLQKGGKLVAEKFTGRERETALTEALSAKKVLELSGTQTSLVDINANFANVPFGTKITASSPSPNVNVGTNMKFAGGL